MKLQTKIQLFTSLFMLILVILINAAVYFLFYKISDANEVEELKGQTNQIVETLSANPEIPQKDLLRAFLPEKGMIRVYAADTSQAIATVTKEAEYRFTPGEFSDAESSEVIKQRGEPRTVLITKPIIWDDGTVVSLQVSKRLEGLQETMRTLFYVLSIASIVIIIPMIIGGIFLSRFLLQPIKTFIHTMKDNTQEANWKKIHLQNRSKDELYEMEKTFNEMIEHLKENYEKQEVFVSDASHELKTPISIVKSYAQLLARRGKDNPEIFNEAVQAIDSEADRMQKLVEQMLLLAKNQQDSSHEIVDLAHLSRHTISTFQGAYDRNIMFHCKEENIFIQGNEDQLQQVIYILVDNALKYSKQDVTVEVTKSAQKAQLSVTDLGQGVPEAEQAKIFERFYRIDKARSRDTGGTGLGLAIAKSITELHGGRLILHSKEGEGSTFIVELPILKED